MWPKVRMIGSLALASFAGWLCVSTCKLCGASQPGKASKMPSRIPSYSCDWCGYTHSG